MLDFIKLEDTLKNIAKPEAGEFKEVLAAAKELKGLSLQQVAVLLGNLSEEQEALLYETAALVKKSIYGKRLVLFAPLYLTNHCTNNCLYCGFRTDNKKLIRKTLTQEEVLSEVKFLEEQGHKRLLLVAGEHPKHSGIEHIISDIEFIYGNSGIRRLNINCAPLDTEDFITLRNSSIGTYQLFQETYHEETYRRLHPTGKKADYTYRLWGPLRALEAGIEDIGIGALFGLYDFRFEVLALLEHAAWLERMGGVGPHTISVPRLKQAEGALIAQAPWPVTDHQFKQITAVLRLAVPYTGIILSTREKAELRDELLDLGVSQLSAGSSTAPGGYEHGDETNTQFAVDDHRSLAEMVMSICNSGHLPSFCTACYRSKRTGSGFMGLAKSGDIKHFCDVNALLTFKEYILDYGDKSLQETARNIIRKHIDQLADSHTREIIREKISKLEHGQRDVYL